MSVQSYRVTGMTCGHCVKSVSEEIGALPGVTQVDVDLPSGEVTVTSDAPLEEERVRAAVEEAGYEMAGGDGPGGLPQVRA